MAPVIGFQPSSTISKLLQFFDTWIGSQYRRIPRFVKHGSQKMPILKGSIQNDDHSIQAIEPIQFCINSGIASVCV
jgi:hypothetical protein